jgi:SAM-dependent methyltransferase
MSKQAEIDYLARLDPASLAQAAAKPWADPGCGDYLIRIGALMTLLPPPPARLLDLGCGTGWASGFFARRGYAVTGVDLAPDMIELAGRTQLAPGLDLRFAVGDFDAVPDAESFEIAVFFDSLHHSLDEGRALAAAWRALAAGGVCVTSEPGRGHARSAEAREAVARFGVTERDMPPAMIVAAARRAGFRDAEIFPHPSSLNTAAFRPAGRGWRRLLGWSVARALALAWLQLVHRHRVGLVLLRK